MHRLTISHLWWPVCASRNWNLLKQET